MTSPDFLSRDTSITRNDRATYKSVLERIADEWHENPPPINAVPGSQHMYDETSEAVIDLLETHPDQAERFHNSAPARDGIGIINRYMYLGARTLVEHGGTTVPEIENLMRHPKTFSNLHRITREHRKAAGQIERANGLRSTPFADIDEAELSRYRIGAEGELEMVEFERDRDEARQRLYSQGDLSMAEAFSIEPSKDPIRCKGSRIIPATYRALLHICAQDPRLFAATLERHQ